MAKCENCTNVYWKDTSTGICSEAYCKLTDTKTPINPWAEHEHMLFHCAGFCNTAPDHTSNR